ncbi:uncharacterized protein im:7147486 [Conger conger]|uniref:uncharacterized protein im:7147486 n=1 Tax=Conger conger TaxID=82655 RepID=UPI002A5A11C3|nr:uncharacterized protein im:7147486 [Conger conger]XP_061093941.1 uncharacterized protein im:7147486 [Conger conger]
MLGLQNTRTGGDLPTKTYRCVACAATFPGLSSLLVHQASHANDGDPLEKLQLPPSSPGIYCTHCCTAFASKELMNQHQCGALTTTSSSFMCECGEHFQHRGALMDHKKLHNQGSDLQVQDCSIEGENKCKTKGTASSPLDHTNPPSCQGSHLVSGSESCPSDLQRIPLLTGSAIAPENDIMEDFSVATSSQSNFNKVPLVPGQPTSPSVSQPEDQPSLFGCSATAPFLPSNAFPSSSILPLPLPLGLQQPKKTLKKMLFSEFMKRLPPAQLSWNHTKGNSLSKNAVSTVVGVEASPASSSGPSVSRLRKLLANSAAKRSSFSQASAILNLISSSKSHPKRAGYIVSLNRTFLPVVALVTRQTLLGSGNDGLEGRHQCGRCRKIFQDVDSLILHHAVHRKERINGCHHCGRLLIGKLAFTENHLCPQTTMLSPQDIFSVGILLSSSTSAHAHSTRPDSIGANPLQQPTTIPSAKRNYHCFLCNQSYTRLYRLKKHKCVAMTSILKAAASHKKVEVSNTIKQKQVSTAELEPSEEAGDESSLMHKSVGVGTVGPEDIKVEAFDVGSVKEAISSRCLQADGAHIEVSPDSPETLMPFLNSAEYTPSNMVLSQTEGSCDFPVQHHASLVQGHLEEDKTEGKMASGSTLQGKGKWTMPIDDSEIDQLLEAEGAGDDDDDDDDEVDSVMESIVSTQNQKSSQNSAFLGVRKYFACSHCGRTYTRRFTLHQHQKKCHLGVRPPMQQNMRVALPVSKAVGGKQSFDCLQCGRSFCYRDTLVLHQKNCQPRNGRGNGKGGYAGPKKRSSMPQGPAPVARPGRLFVLPPYSQAKGSKGPENKTQAIGGDWGIMSLPSVLPRKVTCECGEGFTCPRLLFEHLQLHAQESYICPNCGDNLPSWQVFEAHLRKHQRTACQNCNQTFSQRWSLVRHLKEKRCKGNSMMEKKHCCPRCKLELPNAVSLKLHMQSLPCKPSRKLIRCPVCTRAFGGVEELQGHLMAHSHPNAFHCQLCLRSYPTLRSLKDHRRKVHRKKEKCFGQESVAGVAVL